MNITSHKTPYIIWITIMLAMGLLYACPEDGGGSGNNLPPLTTEDITYDYDGFAQGTAGTATLSSDTITDLSILTFSIAPVTIHLGTPTSPELLPTIAEDGTITTTADTRAGSYRVTITPDGSTFRGPLIVGFYVTMQPADIEALDTMLETAITNNSVTGDFNYIDTSTVATMSFLFKSKHTPGTGAVQDTRTYVQNFNGDISKWNVSAVKDFRYMFAGASRFNQDIGDWNVSTGTDFSFMFDGATRFNQDIGKWVVSSGTDFRFMFQTATSFNQDIGDWNVSAGTDFSYMFSGATAFNQDLVSWSVNRDADKTNMFTSSGVTNPPTWYTNP